MNIIKKIFIFTILILTLISCKLVKPQVNGSQNTPTISIQSPTATDGVSNSIDYKVGLTNVDTITFSANDLTLVTTGTMSGTLSLVSLTESTFKVTIANISGTGSIGFKIAPNIAKNSKTNKQTPEKSSPLYEQNSITPTISISSPSSSLVKNGSVNYTVSYTNANTIELTAAKVTLVRTGTANGTVTIFDSTANSKMVTVSSITGDGTIGIALAYGTATSADGTKALETGTSEKFTVDNTGPIISLSAPTTTKTKSGPVTYTVTYTGASTISLTSSMITLNKTGTSNGVVTVSGTGTNTRYVTIDSITGTGSLGISIAANSAVDTLSNGSNATSNSTTFLTDETAPGLSISSPSLSDTSTGPITFTANYVDVTSISLQASHVSLVRTGTANATGIAVSGSGTTSRTITLSGITGDGTIGISIAQGTGANASGTTTATASSTTFNVDNTKPTLAIGAPSATSTNIGPIDYVVTYTGASTISLTSGQITLNKTGTANGTVSVSGSGASSRTVSISNITGDGTIGFSIAANSATDAVSNSANASSNSATFNVDNSPPTISISSPSSTSTTSGPISFTVSYSGASSVSLLPADVILNKSGNVNATVDVSGTGAMSRTVTLSSITGDGALGIAIAKNSAMDAVGNKSVASSDSATFSISNDPLFVYSWHLKNTGQSAFSSGAGVAGVDLNLMTSWGLGYLGQNVKVLISDTGVQSSHEDLVGNYLTGNVSRDFLKGTAPDYLYSSADPLFNTDSSEAHGTAVAGIIGAVAGNGKGTTGVAPNVKIAGANFLHSGQDLNSHLAQVSGDFNIYNQSWGTSQCTVVDASAISSYIGRLGADRKVYVKSAGNDFAIDLATCSRTSATRHGNSEFDPYNVNPYTIVVAALNASGVKSSYSSHGANIWVTGFGGEYGTSSPAMITPDLSGCTYGFSPNDKVNSFQQSSHPLNTNCNYASNMNGTSSAAPTVSGVIALLLSANPSLTTRDIKHIIATTATKINPTASATSNQYVTSPNGHIWEQGWITNNAGYHFHNYYGFGLINTDAAINMATHNYVPLSAESQTGFISSGDVNIAIPDNLASGATSTITTATAITVEAIQITPKITHGNIGQIGIEITSPRGTKSIITNVNNALDGLADFNGEYFLSNAFYGENSSGTWTLKVIDGSSGTTGVLNNWSLNIVGH